MHINPLNVPRENRTHGDPLFPLASYWHAAPAGETVVDCHWHEEAEFLVVLKGQTLFQIGTSSFPVRAGEAVFVHGGDIHAGHPLGDSECSIFAIVFDMRWLGSGLLDRLHHDYIAPLLEDRRSLPQHYTPVSTVGAAVLQALAALREDAASTRPGFELAIKARLYLILAEIASSGHWSERHMVTDQEVHRLESLKRVLAYIETHYQSRIYLHELAQLAHMGEAQFCRFFKKLVHKSPIAYINSYRVKRAAVLLQQRDRKLLDIAMEVGFDNPSYFTKRFKEELRCTPAEFRKRLQLND